MISLNELLSGHSIVDVPHEHQINLQDLQVKINIIRAARGIPMTVTSGYRFKSDQLRIYRARGIPDDQIPMGSMHLKGKACDIYDEDGSLMKWCRENVALLEVAEVWIEDDPSQPRVHFQTEPPKSGNRFFKP